MNIIVKIKIRTSLHGLLHITNDISLSKSTEFDSN